MYYDRGGLKQSAKAVLSGPWLWVVTLLLLLLSVHVPAVLCALIPGVDLGAALAAVAAWWAEGASPAALRTLLTGKALPAVLAVGALLAVYQAALWCGYAGYALKLYRGERARPGTLFGGFSRLGTVFGATAVAGLFSLLWGGLIYGLAAEASMLMLDLSWPPPAEAWFWLLFFFTAAAVVHSVVVCRYCLAPYFILTQPEKGALSAVAESVEAMRGRAGQRWFLKLSFVGWDLLLALVVVLLALAAAVVDVVSSDAGLARLGVLAEQAVAETGAGPALEQLAAALSEMAPRLLLAALAVWLIQLPFQLWLMAYKGVSYAGFFHVATGGEILEDAFEEEPEEEARSAPAVPAQAEPAPVPAAAPAEPAPVPAAVSAQSVPAQAPVELQSAPAPAEGEAQSVPAPPQPAPAPAVAPYTPFYPGTGEER